MNEYKKRSALNIATDLGGKILILIVGLILPKLYIENFGSDTNGLISSIHNLLVYVNLLEAGIGGAATQSLYGTIAKKDNKEINGILSATNQFYRRTGTYFMLLVCILAVIYPYCVETELSFGLVSCLVLLSALPSAMKYFFQGKYTILLNADNRAYILNTVTLITTLLTNFSRIGLILLGFDIVMVQLSYAIVSLAQLIIIYTIIRKKYSFLDLKVKPNTLVVNKSKYVLVHTISATVFSNIDVLVLTLFCDLTTVSIYSIYHTIFLQVNQMIKGLANGTSASFGQLYAKGREKFTKTYITFKVGYRFAAGAVLLAEAILTLPFIRIYACNFMDAGYIDMLLPILFFLSNYLDVIRWPEVVAVNCTGFFRETARQAIFETMINFVLSIGLVHQFGIYGVLLATIGALLYRTIDFFVFVSKNITREGYMKDMVYMLTTAALAIVIILFTEHAVPVFYNWILFFLFGIASLALSSIIYLIITALFYRSTTIIMFRQLMYAWNSKSGA